MTRVHISLCTLILTVIFCTQSAYARTMSDIYGKISSPLADVVRLSDSEDTSAQRPAAQYSSRLVKIDENNRVHVYVHTDDIPQVSHLIAEQSGEVVTVSERFSVVEAWVPAVHIAALAEYPVVRRIRPVSRPILRTGQYLTEGDAILGTNTLRQLGHDGTGVKVGVISDDVDNLAAAQSSGDVPQTVDIIERSEEDGDEGTAMLEIVHDMAPGAQLAFATGTNSSLQMAEVISSLADAGCDVIVDDIGWFDQQIFEDGPLAQAVDAVVERGVTYVSAAGNAAGDVYRGVFTPDGGSGESHMWDGVSDTLYAITIPPGQEALVVLFWDDPFDASSNDYDLYLYDSSGRIIEKSDGPQDGDDEPWEALVHENRRLQSITAYVVVRRFSGDARSLFLLVHGAEQLEYGSDEGSVWGHAASRGAIAVGAIRADEPGHDEIEYFSSQGPVDIRYPTEEIRMKPDVCGIDGVTVSGTGGFDSPFYGTSAAAPHIAAVAAVLLSIHTDWTPDDVRSALTETARDLGAEGPDNTYGYGLVNAVAASGLGTPITDEITASLWSIQHSPYIVLENARIPAGNQLTVDTGVHVLFQQSASLTIDGSLVVQGEESNPVEFTSLSGNTWGGLQFTENSEGHFSHVHIENCENAGEDIGGAVSVVGNNASVHLEDALLQANSSAYGSGVYISGSSTVTAERVQIVSNNASEGAAVDAVNGADISLTRCTLYGNDGGSLRIGGNSVATISNCILWGDGTAVETEVISGSSPSVSITYSDVRMGYDGTGNISADPRLTAWTEGGYELSSGSPCIDTGSPDIEDADGTRSDMGAAARYQTFPWEVQLPEITVCAGRSVNIDIYGTVQSVPDIHLAFAIEGGIPGEITTGELAKDNLSASLSVSDDTVKVHITASDVFSLVNRRIIRLHLTIPNGTTSGNRPLTWLTGTETRGGNQLIPAIDGALRIARIGDTTNDGVLTSDDVSRILNMATGSVAVEDTLIADVSGDGTLSALDASLVDYALDVNEYLFPSQGGTNPFEQISGERVVYFTHNGDQWEFRTSDPSGIVSGVVELKLENDITAYLVDEDGATLAQNDSTVRIAFIRDPSETGPLFTLSNIIGSPSLIAGQFNEGSCTAELAPETYRLHQNAPNPFNAETSLSYDLPQPGSIVIRVYSVIGQRITSLVQEDQQMPGSHTVTWSGQDSQGRTVGSGIYVCRLEYITEDGDRHTSAIRMTYIR